MAESPDFVRNQDFSCIFAPDNLLAVFSDPTADPRSQTGEGWKAPDRARQEFFCLVLFFQRICWLMTPPMVSAASCFICAVAWV